MIIITGASGYLGQYLAEELNRAGENVLATARSIAAKQHYDKLCIPFSFLDITKKEEIKKLPKNGVEAVIHLAALVPKPPKEFSADKYLDVNAMGTLNMLEYCRKNNIPKFIYTMSHYEACFARPMPIKDDMTEINYNDDHTIYIISKIAAKSYVIHYNEAYGIQGCILRMSGVRGVNRWSNLHDSEGFNQGFWEIFIEKARKSEPIEVWGNNNYVRDHLYLKDAVNAIILAFKSNKAKGVYNIASGLPTTLEEEIKNIISVFSPKDNLSKLIYKPEKPGLVHNFYYDISKAKRDFGYEPQFTYYKMLEDHKKMLESNNM